jgi:hypothetical protein
MQKFALVALVFTACNTFKNSPPPKPTSETAFLFESTFGGGGELYAIDLATREAGRVLGPEAISEDSIVRTFGETLYVVGRDFSGQNNTLTVLDPKAGYARACPECQWPLGDSTNAQDFWAVSKNKAYFTTLPANKDKASYAHRNEVAIINPLTGIISGYIDIAKALVDAGDDLASVDTDGYHELGALYADDEHLFVAIGALNQETFQQVTSSDPCGFAVGRVAVIDIATDKVVKIIKLTGSNPSPSPGRFVPEPNSNYLLIATPGPLSQASTESCGGIERIDQVKLTNAGLLFSETALGGSAMAFDLDAKGNGLFVVFTDGGFIDPTYELKRWTKDGVASAPVLAPGKGALFLSGFVRGNDRGEAYVGLPLASGGKIGIYDLATGSELKTAIDTNLPPVDVSFFPGVPYRL